MIGNYFHVGQKLIEAKNIVENDHMVETPLIFECSFPNNPTNKTKFEVPFESIRDNNIYKEELKKLKSLFYDEVESLFNKVPYTRYFKEHNRVVVFFSSDK